MGKRFGLVVALLLTLGSGMVIAQPFSAQIQLALQTLGLWPYGVYADGEVPEWNAAANRFLPGSGGGGSYPQAIPASTCAAPSLGLSGGATTGIAFTATPSILTCIGGTAVVTWTSGGVAAAGNFLFAVGAGNTLTLTADGNENIVFTNGLRTNSTLRIGNDSTIQWNSNGSLRVNHGIPNLFLWVGDNGGNNSDSLGFRRPTEAVTGSKTIATFESNFTFVTGDTDGQTFTLPDNPNARGHNWRFLVTQTQTSNSMSIAPPSGETLRDGISSCTTFTATTAGASADVEVSGSGAGGHFTVVSKTAGWTCVPVSAPVACTSPTITWASGTAIFQVDVGTTCAGVTTLAVTLPAASNGWICSAVNLTAEATRQPAQTADSATSVTITNFDRTLGTAADWADGTDVRLSCVAG